MQVSHANDHVTHAVIGGKKSIEFGISNSAEFFNILSSTLYKDQILAVVREVLCNAWDAHIEAGCTDRAVVVTLTSEKFIVQDFGKGIHHDDIGPIYGVYGNSTKKNDGNQTGGFGLGCKAPFAYTDHFDVTSCHNGVKTLYNMSKSSAQTTGKPGINTIASFPTTDSGLTVAIRINPRDYTRFNALIKQIAHNGDMNVKMNDALLPTLNFDVSKNNFIIVRSSEISSGSRVAIRYGNVIYPAESDKNVNLYSQITDHLNTLRGTYPKPELTLIFQAPPHSIAVTPSRESLSMQDHTVNTLTKLYSDFINSLNTEFMEACNTIAEEITSNAVTNKRLDVLLSNVYALPFIEEPSEFQRITNFTEMAKVYLQSNYPEDGKYQQKDIVRRLNLLIKENLVDRGKAHAFLKEAKNTSAFVRQYRYINKKDSPTWLQRKVIAPLLADLTKAGLPTSNLLVCNSNDHNKPNVPYTVLPLIHATKSCPIKLVDNLPFLRNIVVLSFRRQGLKGDLSASGEMEKYGEQEGYFVYIVGRKKGDLEAARHFFESQKMVIVDVTPEQAVISTTSKPDKVERVIKKGVPRLDCVMSSSGNINTTHINKDDATRITDPEFIQKVSFRGSSFNYYSLPGWSSSQSTNLIKLFGSKGGITNNTNTYDKWIKKGAKNFTDYVIEKVSDYILENPRIKEYWENSPNRILSSIRESNSKRLLTTIINSKELSAEFGFINNMTEEDKIYLSIWNELVSSNRVGNTNKTSLWLKDIVLSPIITDLCKKLESPMVNLIDTDQVRYMLQARNPIHTLDVIKVIKHIINM